jgi:hypothetical protein
MTPTLRADIADRQEIGDSCDELHFLTGLVDKWNSYLSSVTAETVS